MNSSSRRLQNSGRWPRSQQRFADETRRAEIKQNYQALADIWEAKAKAAENHQNDVAANLNNDLLDYIKDQNVFMERLLTMLNNGLVSKDLREFARFRTTLQEIIIKHEFLRGAIRTWRSRMLGEPSAPQPEPEPQKSEAEPAAPPPQVKQVAFSTPMPAVPPKPSYWDQVREQEARWEDEMNGLLTIVAEQPPAALQEPRAAVSACIEQKMRNADRTSSYFESLVRHGDAIETGLVTVQRTAQRLCGLLEQSPAAEPSLGSRPLTEHGIRWAVAAIRRGEEPHRGRRDPGPRHPGRARAHRRPRAGPPGCQRSPTQAFSPAGLPGPRSHARLPLEFLGDDSTRRRVAGGHTRQTWHVAGEDPQ